MREQECDKVSVVASPLPRCFQSFASGFQPLTTAVMNTNRRDPWPGDASLSLLTIDQLCPSF